MKTKAIRLKQKADATPIEPGDLSDHGNVGLMLRYTFRSFTRVLQLVTTPYGLTAAEFRILRTLATDSAVTQVRLAALAAMDRPYAALIVKQLRDKKLVESRPDPFDGRRALIRLSKTGTAMLAEIDAQLNDVNAHATSDVEPVDYATFVEVMARIRANLEAYEARFNTPDED